MKFSTNWISELTGGFSVEPRELANLITTKTAEQEGVEEFPGAEGVPADWVIEIDNKSLTHRPDLWGHVGMARKAAAILGRKLADPVELAQLPAAGGAPVSVQIEDYALCPRYSALVFEHVTVMPSPAWLRHRLEAIGLNPINNIVDVTNYVMAEIAQPMHAFDADKLNGNIISVRLSKAGESIVALNKESYALDEQALVIADASGPVAIAGVIGGLDSGVTDSTTRLVLESANFHASHIRKTSTRLRCRTDASMRFEKSQDPHNTVRGLAWAIQLLQEVSPGIQLIGGLIDNCSALKSAPELELPLDWLRRKLGRAVETAEVRAILEALEFGVSEPKPGVLKVTVPSWRATKDISIKDDLVEEVGRMLGYGSIAPTPPAVPASPPPANSERDFYHDLRATVRAQGFTEVYNYSFVNEAQIKELGIDPEGCVRVLNPIAAGQELLRTTLVAGALKNVRDNARHFDHCRFFEIGYEIHRREGELPSQVPHLAAVVYSKDGDGVAGLLEVKRLGECILKGASVVPALPRPFEHPHRSYEVVWRGHTVGRAGEFHPNLVQGRASLLDLDLGAVLELPPEPVIYHPLRRFPASAFDLSVVTDARTLVGEIQGRIRGDEVLAVEFVRLYSGPPLAEGRKSVSFRITVGAAERTLSAEEIGRVRSQLIADLEAAGYEFRL